MNSLKTIMDNHINENIYPFHMPGHKQNFNFFNNNELNQILKYDLTEIPNLDNLNDPKEVLLTLNNRISKIYNSYKSFLVINGSTTGVISSILSICNQDDYILASRNSHKSLFSGIELAKCNVCYLYPTVYEENIIGHINPCDIENELKNNDKIKAVFITSPTYEGVLSDIKEISKIVHKYNKILIVDEAHGAHLSLHDYFPSSAIDDGADIVIQSLHKTLPALTQTSVVHISNRIDENKIQKYISMLQTSSPSYIFMYTVDKLIQDIENNKLEYNSFIEALELFRNKFNETIGINKKITLFEPKNVKLDKSKLTFILNCDLSGSEIDFILRNEFNIQLEMSGLNHFIAISTVADTKKGFDILYNALFNIDKKLEYKKNQSNDFYYISNIQKLNPYEIDKYKEVSLYESENLICADSVIPYPPGIPILLAGEVITNGHIELILKYLNTSFNVIGINDFKIKTYYKED